MTVSDETLHEVYGCPPDGNQCDGCQTDAISSFKRNCGHYSASIRPNAYGYTWCEVCGDKDVIMGLLYCSRICGRFNKNGTTVESDWGMLIGRVIEDVAGPRSTPSGGKYWSHKITVVDPFNSSRWYANVKQDTDAIILRRA